jgi:hypothetical protein
VLVWPLIVIGVSLAIASGLSVSLLADRPTRHERCLANIERLEIELGIRSVESLFGNDVELRPIVYDLLSHAQVGENAIEAQQRANRKMGAKMAKHQIRRGGQGGET